MCPTIILFIIIYYNFIIFSGGSYGKASGGGGVPENRFPPVRQTIPRGTDAISWYLLGDHCANVSYKYEGVLKVVRRSRATLLFSVGVPMVKPRRVPKNRFPPD